MFKAKTRAIASTITRATNANFINLNLNKAILVSVPCIARIMGPVKLAIEVPRAQRSLSILTLIPILTSIPSHQLDSNTVSVLRDSPALLASTNSALVGMLPICIACLDLVK